MLLATAGLALAACLVQGAAAQMIYRSVGPDGRQTFSDRELGSARAAVSVADARTSTPADTLPYGLREVQARFPVTLYTAGNCSPCASARALLTLRGIPFTELTVQTPADGQALRALSGQDVLPFATIGQQHVSGFSADEWRQYLDAAGYPQTSVLPSNYRPPAPRALAPLTPAAAAPAAQAPANAGRGAPTPPPASNRVSPTNPAGLSF
ncbi:MAG: glutaredoxin family protein [Comamonas sp.]